MEPPSPYTVSVVNESGRRIAGAPIKSAVKTVLRQHSAEPCSVCVLLAPDETVRALNLEFRKIDEPTDVLTFPAASPPSLRRRRQELGDVAIAVSYAERQAALRNVALATEICYLAIHGTLHLMGFDDESEADRVEMQRQMNVAAKSVGLPPDDAWSSIAHVEGATS